MARRTSTEPMGLAALELAVLVAGAAAVLAAVVGIGFGIWFMLDTGVGLRYGEPVTIHPHLGLGFVTTVFGSVLAVVAWLLALLLRSEARPRRHAVLVALAAQRARDEL